MIVSEYFTDLISFLRGVYACGVKDVSKVFLCGELDHFAADYSDKGWGCGFRNTQMLLSALLLNPTYQKLIHNKIGILSVPSVPKIQSCIELAWKEGIGFFFFFYFKSFNPSHSHSLTSFFKDLMKVVVNNLVESLQIQRNGLVQLKLLLSYGG